MRIEKAIGTLMIVGAIGIFTPYLILTFIFDYPNVLRQNAGDILIQFHAGGSTLIITWLGFALFGLPLLVSYSLLGKKLESRLPFVRWVTTVGIVSGIVQIIGLLRWVFVVPVLANEYTASTEVALRTAITTSFKVVHQFGGVLLGEHLGQLLTVAWTTGMSYALFKISVIPRWLALFGYLASAIYLLAQAESLATVIPGFLMWNLAGLAGSTLWLIWLIMVGIKIRNKVLIT